MDRPARRRLLARAFVNEALRLAADRPRAPECPNDYVDRYLEASLKALRREVDAGEMNTALWGQRAVLEGGPSPRRAH